MKSALKFGAAMAILVASIGLTLYATSGKSKSQDRRLPAAPRQPKAIREPVDLYQDIDNLTEAELAALTRAAFAAGNYRRAAELSETLCRSYPDQFRNFLLQGEIKFADGEMNAAVNAFDNAIRLNPVIEPRLWQRGLALYYADRFAEGVKQFETHQTVNSQDVENAVWHLLCNARLAGLKQAREELISIERDGRVPMAQIYQMFAGILEPNDVLKAANQHSPGPVAGSNRHHLQLYYAHLYIGLYLELIDERESSLDSIKRAAAFNPLPDDNFMGNVSAVHLQLRNSTPDSNSKQAPTPEIR